FGCRNIMTEHELLGEVLTAFKSGAVYARPNHGYLFQVWIRLKVIPYALHQRCFRPHHHQFYAPVEAKLAKAGKIINTDGNILRHLRGAGIARGYIQRTATRALLNLP